MNRFMPITFNNLSEIEKFLERHKLPKLIQKEIDNQNSPILIEKIEFIVGNFPTIKKFQP